MITCFFVDIWASSLEFAMYVILKQSAISMHWQWWF